MTSHSVTLAWDGAVNSGSFTYVIEASFGYRVGVPQTQTSYTWTRDLYPGRTFSFVMWAGDAKGRESAKSNTVTVALPVDTTAPAAPVVSVTGTTSSTVGLAWPRVADDDYTCCTYRVFANGALVSDDNLLWTGERAVTVLRLAAATTHSFTVVAVDPSRNASAPSAAVAATTQPNTDTTAPTAPGNLSAFDFGCETWLFWDESVDDVDPQAAILYEVRVNGVFDGAQTGIDRWITYGTQASNTFSVQAIDSAGNRSPISSLTLDIKSADRRRRAGRVTAPGPAAASVEARLPAAEGQMPRRSSCASGWRREHPLHKLEDHAVVGDFHGLVGAGVWPPAAGEGAVRAPFARERPVEAKPSARVSWFARLGPRFARGDT